MTTAPHPTRYLRHDVDCVSCRQCEHQALLIANQYEQRSVTVTFDDGEHSATVKVATPSMLPSLTCPICGLAVGDEQLHAEWHCKLDRVSEAADAYGAGGISAAMRRWNEKHAPSPPTIEELLT